MSGRRRLSTTLDRRSERWFGVAGDLAFEDACGLLPWRDGPRHEAPVIVKCSNGRADAQGCLLRWDVPEQSAQCATAPARRGPDSTADDQCRCTDRIQGAAAMCTRVGAKDQRSPVLPGDRPLEPFETGAKVGRHEPRIAGIPEKHNVSHFEPCVPDAQGDALKLGSLPHPQVATNGHMPCVKSQPGKHAEPFIEDCGVLGDRVNRLHLGDVDEGREEAVKEIAAGFAFRREADGWLRQKSLAVGNWLGIFEVGIERLVCRDGEVRVAFPTYGQRPAALDAAGGEPGGQPFEQV